MREPLTKIQRETLDFIIEFNRKHRYMPSYFEMEIKFKIASSSMFDRMQSLIKKGWIETQKGRARWIKIL